MNKFIENKKLFISLTIIFFILFITSLVYQILEENSFQYFNIPNCLSPSDFNTYILNKITDKNQRNFILEKYYFKKSLSAYCLDISPHYHDFNELKKIFIDNNIYYEFSPETRKKIIPPKCLTQNILERYILNKIVDEKEKEIILKSYNPKNDHLTYCLDKNVDYPQIKNIIIKTGYYTDLVDRNMETPIKKVLIGYLGQFFFFQYVGVLNWLAIPSLIFFLAEKKIKRKYQALIFIYIASNLIINLKFNYNPRYQITLLPFTLFTVLLFYDSYLKKIIISSLFIPFIILIVLTNYIRYNFGYKLDAITISKFLYRQTNSIIKTALTQLINPNSNINESKKVLRFINTLPIKKEEKILVNNLPFFFYYTTLPGIYYWSGSDIYYTQQGIRTLFGNNNLEYSHYFLKDVLKCKYILSKRYFNQYNQKFDIYLKKYTQIIFSTDNFVLYKIE